MYKQDDIVLKYIPVAIKPYSFIYLSSSTFCVTLVTILFHLRNVVHGDIQGGIVQRHVGSFYTGYTEVTLSFL